MCHQEVKLAPSLRHCKCVYRKQISLSDKTLVGGNLAFAFHLQLNNYSRYRQRSLLVQSG